MYTINGVFSLSYMVAQRVYLKTEADPQPLNVNASLLVLQIIHAKPEQMLFNLIINFV